MRKIALLAAVIALAACNNDSTSPNGSAQGSYSLHTVNGNPLPFTFSDGSVLVSDQLTLNSNGTYVDVATFSNAGTATEQGLWSINNNLISFQDQTGVAPPVGLPATGGGLVGFELLWPRGNDVHVPPETRARIRLNYPVTVRVVW